MEILFVLRAEFDPIRVEIARDGFGKPSGQAYIRFGNTIGCIAACCRNQVCPIPKQQGHADKWGVEGSVCCTELPCRLV